LTLPLQLDSVFKLHKAHLLKWNVHENVP
jgi:hypothetical protein